MARDETEFTRVYEEHVWSVYGFIGYRVAAREQAEDLTQLTFERALKAWHRYDPSRASEQRWLLSIARNVVIDDYRRGRSRGEVVGEIDESRHAELIAEGPEEGALGLDPELEAALGSLGDREREIIALRFGGDMTGAEIADLTGLSLANVQQILSRTLRRLRDRLEAQRERPAD